jgi:hypothetical protein
MKDRLAEIDAIARDWGRYGFVQGEGSLGRHTVKKAFRVVQEWDPVVAAEIYPEVKRAIRAGGPVRSMMAGELVDLITNIAKNERAKERSEEWVTEVKRLLRERGLVLEHVDDAVEDLRTKGWTPAQAAPWLEGWYEDEPDILHPLDG